MTDVKSYKLISGEEIIGKVHSESETEVVLDDVLAVVAQPTQQGLQIGLMPYFTSNDQAQLTITKTAIVTSAAPNKELETGYIQRTSKIDLTSKIEL